MIKTLKTADFLTIGNFISGLLSILFSINLEFTYAALMMLAAVIFDFLDGRVARMLRQENEFGKQLDSLADLTSFAVAPVIIAYTQGLNNTISIVVFFIFATCGMLRLARFNITKTKGFIGIPITTNGYVIPLLYFIFSGFNQYILLYYAIAGVLMISNIKIKKW